MKSFRLIFIIIFTFVCGQSSFADHSIFWSEVKNKIKYVTEIQFSESLPHEFKRPKGVWQTVLEAKVEVAQIEKSFCLLHKVALNDQKGLLGFFEKSNGSCLTQILDLKNTIEMDGLKLLSDPKQSGLLKIEYFFKGKVRNVSIEFLNLKILRELSLKSYDTKKYKSSNFYRNKKGLIYLSSPLNILKKPSSENLQDRYLDKKQRFCHQFDMNCKEVMPFNCDSCKYGWYEVVGKGCPNGSPKVCGISQCGQRGEPACPRGYSIGSKNESGFCERGLKQIYDENEILICL